jgi:hypothetical protein
VNADLATIPGTGIPLCQCCEDEPARLHDESLGPVCTDCVRDLAVATVALAIAGLYAPETHKHSTKKVR